MRRMFALIHMADDIAEKKVADPVGFEPTTIRLEGECSIQLS